MEGWSIVVVRTERGEKYWQELVDAGKVETRPPDEEPHVVDLLERLSRRQRRRPRNVERMMSEGATGPWTVIDTEAVIRKGSPEAAFRAAGSTDAHALGAAATAGASPLGDQGGAQ